MNRNLDNYISVKQRKKDFYKNNPDGRIISEAIDVNENRAFFKATIFKNKDDQEKNFPWSTGYAQEFKGQGGFANKHAWVENCEESAIGRALDNAGFATQCSKEEMKKVMVAEKSKHEIRNPDSPASIHQIKKIISIGETNGYSTDDLKQILKERFELESLKELNNRQIVELYDVVNKRKAKQ